MNVEEWYGSHNVPWYYDMVRALSFCFLCLMRLSPIPSPLSDLLRFRTLGNEHWALFCGWLARQGRDRVVPAF